MSTCSSAHGPVHTIFEKISDRVPFPARSINSLRSDMSKHVINSPSAVVRDALIGSSYLNSSTVITAENATVLRSLTVGRVHLLSGGGSGHSPAHAGFVGEGMLSASVDGQIFASPNSRQVGKTLERVLAANAESR